MAIGKLKASEIVPPTMLGVSTITIKVGQTATISKSTLMQSVPIYVQPLQTLNNPTGLPMGGIKVTGTVGSYMECLTQTNMPYTICYFTNNNNRLYVSGNDVVNGEISNSNLNSSFKVVGVKVGEVMLTYKAKSIMGTTESSDYSSVTGVVHIKVVPNVNNPPTNIDDSLIEYPMGTPVTLNMDFFSNGYTDPDNDPIAYVRIDSLPATGVLKFNGYNAYVGLILQVSHIDNGLLVFVSPQGQPNGHISQFNFSVSDGINPQFIS